MISGLRSKLVGGAVHDSSVDAEHAVPQQEPQVSADVGHEAVPAVDDVLRLLRVGGRGQVDG